MSYEDIRNWKLTNKVKGDKINALNKLSQSIENIKSELNGLNDYLVIGISTFENNKIGNVDYENELKNIKDTVDNNQKTFIKIQEAAKKKISELKTEISENEVKIKNESNRLEKIEREQRAKEQREREQRAKEQRAKEQKAKEQKAKEQKSNKSKKNQARSHTRPR